MTANHRKIHGISAEGNLRRRHCGSQRIRLSPAGYPKDTYRRYPVVHALHGYSTGAEPWTLEMHMPQTIEGTFALGAREMIVVLPGSKTVHNGSVNVFRVGATGDGSPNHFEIYHGTHTSWVAQRLPNHVMPFFSQNLCFQSNCQ